MDIKFGFFPVDNQGKLGKFKILLVVMDIYTRYCWCVPLKNKMDKLLQMHLIRYLKKVIENVIKYGRTEIENGSIKCLKLFLKNIILKCIIQITKGKL